MPNRFTGPIKRGEIESIDELKSEFKTLAKKSHPDLLGPGASGEDFAALRSEYEAALRDFDRHRFGLNPRRGIGPEDSGNQATRSHMAFDRRTLYLELAALRRRGFPKEPRHDKERMRYEYRRFLFMAALGAWNEDYVGLFRAFEAAVLEKEPPEPALRDGSATRKRSEALAFLDCILDWQSRGGDHEKRSLELDFRRFALAREKGGEKRGDADELAGSGQELVGFLDLLVKDMAEGPSMAGARGKKGE